MFKHFQSLFLYFDFVIGPCISKLSFICGGRKKDLFTIQSRVVVVTFKLHILTHYIVTHITLSNLLPRVDTLLSTLGNTYLFIMFSTDSLNCATL